MRPKQVSLHTFHRWKVQGQQNKVTIHHKPNFRLGHLAEGELGQKAETLSEGRETHPTAPSREHFSFLSPRSGRESRVIMCYDWVCLYSAW